MLRKIDPFIDTLESIVDAFDKRIRQSQRTDIDIEEDKYAEGCYDTLNVVINKLRRERSDDTWDSKRVKELQLEDTKYSPKFNPATDRHPMSRKFQIAHLIGKTRDNERRFRRVETELTKMGYICLAPVIYNFYTYKEFCDTIDEMCYEKLLVCDFCVLVTPEYIGKSTSERLLQAEALDIPVFTFNGTRLVPFDVSEVKYNE